MNGTYDKTLDVRDLRKYITIVHIWYTGDTRSGPRQNKYLQKSEVGFTRKLSSLQNKTCTRTSIVNKWILICVSIHRLEPKGRLSNDLVLGFNVV